jgi:LCP family protein required for cell wall assembly
MKKEGRQKLVVLIFYLLLMVLIAAAAVFAYRLSKSREELLVSPDFNLVPATEAGEKIENMYEFETMENSSFPVEELEDLEKTKHRDSEYVHYLILGVDTRDGEKLSKSDAIMILSIDESTGKVVLTSIPRDWYVYIQGKGWDKIAYAYTYGKTALVEDTLELNCDITFSGYFTIGFEGLEDIIDQLGGVEITLTEEESEHLLTFYGVDGTHAGVNLLDGLQTINYCRICKIDSDFVRTNRQYKVLCAIYDKFKETSSVYYPKLVSEFYNYVSTDCSAAECVDIISAVYEEGLEQLDYGLMFSEEDGSGRNIDEVYYFVLDDMEKTIQKWYTNLGDEEYEPSETLKKISAYLASIKK